GGQAAFDALVTAFYERVRCDPLLWPMYPQEDLSGAIRRLSLFLAQFFGGPGAYSEERGHPRLRLRHRPFRIDREAREHWLAHMREALEEVSAAGTLSLSPANRASMLDYFDRASLALINTP
ncbi:MAG: globin, partial [Pseudoclavibacter sp.]|nr:globin [Pseudoclavibacter sp.]